MPPMAATLTSVDSWVSGSSSVTDRRIDARSASAKVIGSVPLTTTRAGGGSIA